LAGVAPPVVVFNKSHSGSRLLGTLIEAAGVFMGAHQNDSKDSWDILPLVEHLVVEHYPDYGPLWNGTATDAALVDIARTAFRKHLEGFACGTAPWGWKLCETTYILPVIDFLFPRAKYIHLIRDGRDVAFSEHRAPNRPFWKKVYFNTDRISAWRGLRFHRRDYARRSHIYNALHWVNSVSVGRAYGAMLRECCLEVRYEALCEDFEKTAREVLSFLQVDEAKAAEAVYGPEGIAKLAKRVHLLSGTRPFDPAELTAGFPPWLPEVECLFTGWSAPQLDEKLLAAMPNLKMGIARAMAVSTTPSANRSRPERALASYQTHSSANVAGTRRP
jgi:hypothetical protein